MGGRLVSAGEDICHKTSIQHLAHSERRAEVGPYVCKQLAWSVKGVVCDAFVCAHDGDCGHERWQCKRTAHQLHPEADLQAQIMVAGLQPDSSLDYRGARAHYAYAGY